MPTIIKVTCAVVALGLLVSCSRNDGKTARPRSQKAKGSSRN